ncbi:hypothetical protein B0H19DRAFT_1061923 [Mycena capillaripes]|nr:hypothetical protein B0H19DRAFT_1061923 [Mycena capillaripes]
MASSGSVHSRLADSYRGVTEDTYLCYGYLQVNIIWSLAHSYCDSQSEAIYGSLVPESVYESPITILPAEKQLDNQNYPVFKDALVSLVRGRGYHGYLTGAILRPAAPTFSGHPSAPNSLLPSTEEWDLRDGHAGALIYQNVKDPKAHSLSATDTAHEMWIALEAKFNCSSEVLKGLALERLRSAKLASGRNMPVHLDVLKSPAVSYKKFW